MLVVGDHATGVKAAERGDAIRMRGCDRPAEPAAEAVAGDPDRAVGELPELVQVSAAVRGDGGGRQRAHQRTERLEEPAARVRIVEVRRLPQRSASRPVKHVRSEHDIALSGNPIGHLLDPRPEPDRIDHEQDARMRRIASRFGEVTVGDPVRGRHVDS